MNILENINALIEALEWQQEKYAYHGTENGNIDIFEPMTSRVLNNEKAVFVGPKWVAISMTRRWDDSDFSLGSIGSNKNGTPYIKEMYEGAFDRVFSKGKRGWLYRLPIDTFEEDARLPPFEMISRVAVKPIDKKLIKDPIKELQSLGVKLFKFNEEINI